MSNEDSPRGSYVDVTEYGGSYEYGYVTLGTCLGIGTLELADGGLHPTFNKNQKAVIAEEEEACLSVGIAEVKAAAVADSMPLFFRCIWVVRWKTLAEL